MAVEGSGDRVAELKVWDALCEMLAKARGQQVSPDIDREHDRDNGDDRRA